MMSPVLSSWPNGTLSRSLSVSVNMRHRLGVTSSMACAPTIWCHSVATFLCTRTLLSMMVPVIDHPASLRAIRPACSGVMRSAELMTSRNDWLGVHPDAVGRPALVAQRDHRDSGPSVDGETGLAAGQVDDHDVRSGGNRVG